MVQTSRLLISLMLVQQISGYQPTGDVSSRRVFFDCAAGIVGVALSCQPGSAIASTSKYCASGVGEGCADLSEGNGLIKTLQEKSAVNKDVYARVRCRI
jgi:hypothetical protein